MSEQVPVYILAGGKSRRFQSPSQSVPHQDKARHSINGITLLEHVADAAKSVAKSITVVAATPDRYQDLGYRTIADRLPDKGPLGGLDTAITDAPEGWIMLLSCDLFGLRTEWLISLFHARSETANCVLYTEKNLLQPLIALYHTRIGTTVQKLLNEERLSLSSAVLALSPRILKTPKNWDSIYNINTVDDLPRK